MSRHGALKVLSHATAIPDGKANCEKFVEIYGKPSNAPHFQLRNPCRPPLAVPHVHAHPGQDQEEGHGAGRARGARDLGASIYVFGRKLALQVIDALLFQCDDDCCDRVLQKFTEHEYEKVDRLVELFLQYQ